MPTERLSMRRIRDLLRLKHENGLRKRLGGISKSGDGYILKLLTRGARAAVHRVRIHQVKNAWITELLGPRPFNVATVALATVRLRGAFDKGMVTGRTVTSASTRASGGT